MFNSCENISPDSAVVVFKFARWRRNYEDPLKTINYKKLLNDEPEILNGRYGLESYLDDLHEKVK